MHELTCSYIAVQLLSIRENEVRVDLDWGDLALLAHLCRRALDNDALGDAPNWPAVAGHAEALACFFEAAGLASYAPFVEGEPQEYSLGGFRALYPVTGQYAAWQARRRKRGEPSAEAKEAPPAA